MFYAPKSLYALWTLQKIMFFLRFVFALTTIVFIKLRNFYETSRTKMWPETKKLLVLGLELGFLYKNVYA